MARTHQLLSYVSGFQNNIFVIQLYHYESLKTVAQYFYNFFLQVIGYTYFLGG